ncbi:antitoxin Xre/MbcA/ParS toxin-binding domain-containing protein [Phenylobacterium sp.]|uniref:antitoxin Xre/MbcA/ParS toxin-binding domain-containing protein n=1 Tax=Phenylobacterium sp. TaxID=1871053 RepID=UPI0035B07BFE
MAGLEASILRQSDMLSGDGFGQLAGLGPAELDRRRLAREVLAFEVGPDCIRAPMWQVAADRSLLPGLPRLFELLGDDPWAVYLFLTTPHPDFGWGAPLESLRRGITAPVLAAAEGLEPNK